MTVKILKQFAGNLERFVTKTIDSLGRHCVHLMTNAKHPYRCAIYFAPPIDSDWGRAGASWLGRCAGTGQNIVAPIVAGLSPAQQSSGRSEPRRYGWHATLKAPFVLRSQFELEDLVASAKTLGREFRQFSLPALQVRWLDDFLALCPEQESAALQEIAGACVTRLHPFAAPLTASALARRRQSRMTQQQEQFLTQWGYPWVLNEFRFHFSLTGVMKDADQPTRDLWLTAAKDHFAALPLCEFDRLSLFIEPQPGADFELIDQFELHP
jgi:hypothetical protein